MTPDEIKKANLIKMGFQCFKCNKIYEIDHPSDTAYYWKPTVSNPIKDTCNNFGDTKYYYFKHCRTMRNFTHFKVKDRWYSVVGPLVDKFLQMTLVDEAISGSVRYPQPTRVTRQVDLFTVAEKLGLTPPLNDYQKRRAKTKAFIERIKK